KEGKYTGRVLGVEVRALESHKPVRRVSAKREDFQIRVSHIGIPNEIPFPVCLFVFAMDDDEGFYKWIKKPSYGTGKPPQLVRDQSKTFTKLSNEVLDDII